MCEQTEISYLDGEVVWVKLGSCWWPGEVIAPEKLPPDVVSSFRKPPIAVVKFFQEDKYEYVRNINSIYKYNCSKKNVFISKGLYLYRNKHGLMEKFPDDVVHAETVMGGDINILDREEFQETKKQSYAGLFGDTSKKTPNSIKKGKIVKGRPLTSSKIMTPRMLKEKSDYKVHILVQKSNDRPNSENTSSELTSTTNTSCIETENQDSEETGEINDTKQENDEKMNNTFSTPTATTSGIYSCHACQFTTSRLNVLILHNKSHSVTFTAYTPSPVRKKGLSQLTSKSSSKQIKIKKPRKEKIDKTSLKAPQGKKRLSDEQNADNEIKKLKTNEEIKSSLLADWDDVDEELNDESTTMVITRSPDVPVAAESPAEPTSAELPSAQIPSVPITPTEKKCDNSIDKPESSSDSKYEFCEDEDWPLETDAGRKIPRVKNPKRKEDTKSLSLDDEDVAKEVADLLNKTNVPVLPVIPEPLKVEENFPEPSIVKSPDKNQKTVPEISADKPVVETQPTKAIFKTKTFFRSRHSRSQDAIGKYVAEQLNAVERMDISETEINGSVLVSSLDSRESPPIEHLKVARLAPKIQLKKMKAEAAQLKEKCTELEDFQDINQMGVNKPNTTENSTLQDILKHENKKEDLCVTKCLQNVLYPTQEIKPIGIENSSFDKKLINQDTKEQINKTLKESNNDSKILNDKIQDVKNIADNAMPQIKFPDTHNVEKSYDQSMEYMNESTASAVDALLSVSRDTDKVTKVISDDPPDELFEDDNKEISPINNVNGHKDSGNEENELIEEIIREPEEDCEDFFAKIIFQNTFEEDKQVKIQDQFKEPKYLLPSIETNIEINISENTNEDDSEIKTEKTPTESDLQIAETLLNLPSTAVQNATNIDDNDNNSKNSSNAEVNEDVITTTTEGLSSLSEASELNKEISKTDLQYPPKSLLIENNANRKYRFESEREKSENLNAAQSLVQMSETIDHKIGIKESQSMNKKDISNTTRLNKKHNNGIERTVEQKVASLSSENSSENNSKSIKYETSSSKLLKMLEEPCLLKSLGNTQTKQVIVPRKEKILNFDVARSSLKGKAQSSKQQIIIRRTNPQKNTANKINDTGPLQDKFILSRNNNSAHDSSAIQTYTIQTTPEVPSDANTIIIQQKIRKITKPPTKLQKIRPQNSLITTVNDVKAINNPTATDDGMFDINSMPIVLSEDLITAESIEKMPVVMSDGKIITRSPLNSSSIIKTKQVPIECEKVALSVASNKAEVKTLLVNPSNEGGKITTPNILSKSSKLRGAKPMLVIDKTTGKQKIIVPKAEPTVKEVKQQSTLVQSVQQSAKPEKFIILPSPSSPRPNRGQKIVIDPQSGKAHVLVTKGSDTQVKAPENKPVSAKLMPSASDASTPGNTVMIITNAQGAQSRILLTPEHEKILFPNKQQSSISQVKTVAQRITTSAAKTLIKTTIPPIKPQINSATKTNTRIVPKQKGAIITSKGQLIVGNRITSTTPNIAPLPEIRPVPKRIMASEPLKLIQTIQKTTSQNLIFIQQSSGALMQLTASQFEHLQKTGQIVQKALSPIPENRMIMQKPLAICASEPITTTISKTRARKAIDSHTPLKKMKQEIAIAPAPLPVPNIPVPSLTPICNTSAPTMVPSISSTVTVPNSTTYTEFDNFEELLPSTAIVRQPESVVSQPELSPVVASAPLSESQLLAVPGEHFGGPPGSFYLCLEENGGFTPIDHRPLILENNQLVPMNVEPLQIISPQPERRDILEAALANSDVFQAETIRDETPDFRDLNANVSVHCQVSETSTTLNQPIMTPVEVPTKVDSEPALPTNLEDGLAVIGVTPHSVPTSLELPITVTDPRIAPKTTDPLSTNNYGPTLLVSPNTELTFVSTEVPDIPLVGPISMPLLTDEESVGKSMPILTDDVTERTVSSVDSTIGSPSSIDVRESENEDGVQWSRRLLTPGSDISETSAEIPLQPAIQISANDLSNQS